MASGVECLVPSWQTALIGSMFCKHGCFKETETKSCPTNDLNQLGLFIMKWGQGFHLLYQDLSLLIVFCFFETGSHYVALAILELSM